MHFAPSGKVLEFNESNSLPKAWKSLNSTGRVTLLVARNVNHNTEVEMEDGDAGWVCDPGDADEERLLTITRLLEAHQSQRLVCLVEGRTLLQFLMTGCSYGLSRMGSATGSSGVADLPPFYQCYIHLVGESVIDSGG